MEFHQLFFSNLDKILHCWFLVDEDEKIIHWSIPAKRQFGYEEQEILGRPFSQLLVEEHPDSSSFLSRLLPDLHGGSIINYQARLRQKNQVIMDVELSLHQLDDDGKANYLVTLDNITEEVELQKLVNRKMQQIREDVHSLSENRFDNSVRDILDAVLVSITAGQGLRFNRAFLLFVDLEQNALKGVQAIGPGSGEEAGVIYGQFDQAPKTLTEMIESYLRQERQEDTRVNQLVRGISVSLDHSQHLLIQVLKSQKYCLINNQSPFRDLESFHALRLTLAVEECILVPLVWHGQSIGLLIADNQVTKRPLSYLDISALTRFSKTAISVIESIRLLVTLEESIDHVKQANLKIKESEALLVHREKLAAMGQVFAQLAHEVRGPLAIIGGFARRMHKKMPTDNELYDPINRIVDTVQHLEGVVSDILDNATNPVEPDQDCDVGKVINRVLRLLEEQVHQTGVTVNMNLQGKLPNLKIPEHQLYQVINNLVKNALEAMVGSKGKGLLLILANHFTEEVEIKIQDTGVGLDEEDKEKIFSPFYTTKENGTGLGLVVVKKLVEENGGNLTVHSIKGRGTTFSIRFPIKQEPT